MKIEKNDMEKGRPTQPCQLGAMSLIKVPHH
jgi:hypothetical protein